MSQIEQNFRQFLSRHPEIEKCYSAGLVNRRSLARMLIKEGVAPQSQMQAIIAMLRRFPFREVGKVVFSSIKDIKVNIKDSIVILYFEKDKALLQTLPEFISKIDYDKGDTLKIVVGSSYINLFIDEKKENEFKDIIDSFKLKHRMDSISEMSLMFSDEANEIKGIISFITTEFAVNDINITELLTASPELLIYVKEDYVIKAYEIIKRLQK